MASARSIAALAVKVLACVLLATALSLLVAPRLLGWQLHTVLSGSMAPTFGAGSVVAVEPVRASVIQPGDVITFAQSTGVPVTHRVVAVNGSGASAMFVTKGDANETPDVDPRPAGAVIGKVKANVPYLGHFANFMRQPLGFLLLVLIPGGLFILAEVLSIVTKQLSSSRKAASA